MFTVTPQSAAISGYANAVHNQCEATSRHNEDQYAQIVKRSNASGSRRTTEPYPGGFSRRLPRREHGSLRFVVRQLESTDRLISR